MESILNINSLTLKQEHSAGPEILVNHVDLQLRTYRPLSLIGESGCGKSLVGQAVMGIIPDGVAAEGQILYQGKDILTEGRRVQRLWGRELFLYPQEAGRYLDPLVRSMPQIAEVYRRICGNTKSVAVHRSRQMMKKVSLRPEDGEKFPWQLSGGMGQRLLAAISMAQPARVVVADEPTKGLDRELICQTASLLKDMAYSGKALLVITHDLEVARILGGDLAVMYGGRILEVGPAEDVLRHPRHPYTVALCEALPRNGLKPIPRRVNGYQEGVGCVFVQRCCFASNRCSLNQPPLEQTAYNSRLSACYLTGSELSTSTK